MDVDVAVVGAGPVGLTAALLLGRAGLSTLVLERNAGTSTHPRGHVVNARTMEIFRTLGVADAVAGQGLPEARNQGIAFLRRVTEPEIAVLPTKGDLTREALHVAASPVGKVSCPQDRLEPVLLDAARRDPNIQVRFSTEMTGWSRTTAGVAFTCRDPQGDWQGAARFLIGADGARSTVREQAGIGLSGPGRIGRQIGIYFEADLWPLIERRPYLLWWIFNAKACGVLISLDGRHRWTFNFAFDPEREAVADFTPERCRQIVHSVIGTDAIEVHVRSVMPWRMQAWLADHYRSDPVFLAGDAAHPLPPTGGQGMNTGIGDVHNLAWKLALVCRGIAPDALLDSYEAERRPVGAFNITQSVANAMRMAESGLSGMATADSSIARTLEGPGRAEAEAHVRAVVPGLREHFDYLGQTFGHAYETGAFVPDGSPAPAFSVLDYEPSARPGHRAPHLWLEQDGAPVSTVDLVGHGGFTVLATSDSRELCDAFVSAARARNLPVQAWTIGAGSELSDPNGAFPILYGLERGGAVLIRPDGYVACRWTVADHPRKAVAEAIDAVLGRARQTDTLAAAD